jgi:hypothetical protein
VPAERSPGRPRSKISWSRSHLLVCAPELATLQGLALAAVFPIIISEAGWRTVEGQSQEKIARDLHPVVENALAELDRWFCVSATTGRS